MHLAPNIDIQHGLIGRIILGVSSSAFMLLSGKVTGLSGIAEGIISVNGADWNLTYMAGLVSSGLILHQVNPEAFGNASSLAPSTLAVAGLLTGFGTRLSGGCTSGHGLCGLSRRSPRSLVAVLTFMTTGAITAYITRLPEIVPYLQASAAGDSMTHILLAAGTAITGLYATMNFRKIRNNITGLCTAFLGGGDKVSEGEAKNVSSSNSSRLSMHLASYGAALAFGCGLGISGMANTERVLRFLDFSGSEGWDPTLMSVLGGGVAVTFLSFHLFKHTEAPVVLEDGKHLGASLKMGCDPANMKFDWKLIVGSAMFGMGWGLAGMCPGPAVISFAGQMPPAMMFVPSMMIGMVLKELIMG